MNLNCGHLLLPRIMTSKSGCSSTITQSPTSEHVTNIWTMMDSKATSRHCCDPHSCIRDFTFFAWSNGFALFALSDFPLFSKRQQTDEELECPCSKHVVNMGEYIASNTPECLTLITKKQQPCFSAKPHNDPESKSSARLFQRTPESRR